ncbi:unnamed protein product [Calicophoron daubneyi]|uniref:DUF3421 domain-containing protein n=1 Tax=Calicophoron daubneyi TaxID=300641 RepID=A0AAV2SXI0_CALDB
MPRIGKDLVWRSDQYGHVPDDAVEAGPGVYVGRMEQSGDLIPGKIVPDNDKGYVAYGGKEWEHDEYEVLCTTNARGSKRCYTWVHDSDGHVPDNAIEAGQSDSGDTLYIARTKINNETVVGKVHDGLDFGYFPYGGKEVERNRYEVLAWREDDDDD